MLLAFLAGEVAGNTAAAEVAPLRLDDTAFAQVDETMISAREYEATVAGAVRRKFYHGKPPEGELAAFRREVGEALIDRVLLEREAKRRGLRADEEKIADFVVRYEERNRASPLWRQSGEAILAQVRRQLERQLLVEELERAVRRAGEPGEETLRAYYAAHPDLFTEPEQARLSVIVLKVDPSSPRLAWDQATEEAHAIVRRLADGAEFAALARLHSGDASAQNGGELGYLHRGMLPEGVHSEIDRLDPGMVSAPVRVLEGIAIFRLAERRPARLRALDEVRQRAAGLWQREQADRNWNELLARLRKAAVIRIDAARYPEFETAGSGRRMATGR